ncbi:MAG: amidohydrolase family protein [Coriobacteriales bacterium]|nr:amidohydrolase family protein [Coriobacteriales bacterium]
MEGLVRAIQDEYRVADAHAHIYPSKIAAKATAAVGRFYDIPMDVPAGTSQALLQQGSLIGCEKYLVCSVATKVEQVESITRFIAQECEEHPEFIGLGAYHQDVTDPTPVLDLVDALGLQGVKVHPDFQRFYIDDPRLFPLYEQLEERGMKILFHMGDNRYDFSAPIRLLRVLDKYPKLKAIAAHFGGYQAWDVARDLFPGTDIMFDCSSALFFLSPARAQEMVRTYGVEHIMFGVDFPMWSHEDEFHRFLGLGLTHDENKAVLYDNFARFMGID